jgi:hypothetical protein
VKEKTDKGLILCYLLGKLSDEQQYHVELRYFSDDAFYEELLVIEQELIEGYARGEFSEIEREWIKRHFLRSQARRERVIMASACRSKAT